MGYARGIDGSLDHYVRGAHRHLYCSRPVQEQSLVQLKDIIDAHQPDLCCLVEIEQGTTQIRNLNHLHYILNDDYPHYDIANKYGETNILRHLPFHKGRSNGFMARSMKGFEKLYFTKGSKRLVYKITIDQDLTVLFGHFSLNIHTRKKQFAEIAKLINEIDGNVILLADFNIMTGFVEIEQLLNDTNMLVMSEENRPTFRFHKKQLALDLCLCSRELAGKVDLDIVVQPYSDHDALLIDVKTD